MDYDKCLDILYQTEEDIWVSKVNETRLDGRLCDWVTSLLPGQGSYRLDGGFMNGSYNLCQKLRSDNGSTILLRLPRVSSISASYANEKVAMELEAIDLIRKKTTIPVPQIHVWGLAETDPLGLGPFILMEFIEGVCLKEVFLRGSRLLREEVSDRDVECIYRQMANFMLQLFSIDFPNIGSLSTPFTGFCAPTRPLTWKAHDILQNGGVNTFGDRSKGFLTTNDYFQYVIGQDEQQVQKQFNSVTSEINAESIFGSLQILKSMIPEMVNESYNQGPFKLICDDFGPANVIVKGEHDLTIVGVVDMEWVYAGPAQLFASAPWWLLLDRPINEDWDFEIGGPPKVTSRYFRHLEMFKRILSEEEENMPEHHSKEVSKLMTWSEDSGAMWLHMLLSSGFFDWFTFPCMQLRQRVGVGKWNEQLEKINSQKEAKEFVARKLRELEEYDEKVDKVEKKKALLESETLTKEEFIAAVRAIIS